MPPTARCSRLNLATNGTRSGKRPDDPQAKGPATLSLSYEGDEDDGEVQRNSSGPRVCRWE